MDAQSLASTSLFNNGGEAKRQLTLGSHLDIQPEWKAFTETCKPHTDENELLSLNETNEKETQIGGEEKIRAASRARAGTNQSNVSDPTSDANEDEIATHSPTWVNGIWPLYKDRLTLHDNDELEGEMEKRMIGQAEGELPSNHSNRPNSVMNGNAEDSAQKRCDNSDNVVSGVQSGVTSRNSFETHSRHDKKGELSRTLVGEIRCRAKMEKWQVRYEQELESIHHKNGTGEGDTRTCGAGSRELSDDNSDTSSLWSVSSLATSNAYSSSDEYDESDNGDEDDEVMVNFKREDDECQLVVRNGGVVQSVASNALSATGPGHTQDHRRHIIQSSQQVLSAGNERFHQVGAEKDFTTTIQEAGGNGLYKTKLSGAADGQKATKKVRLAREAVADELLPRNVKTASLDHNAADVRSRLCRGWVNRFSVAARRLLQRGIPRCCEGNYDGD